MKTTVLNHNSTFGEFELARLAKNKIALLTPPGRGAVAVIGLLGSECVQVIGQNFSPFGGPSFDSVFNRDIVYGIWKRTGEDLVVCRRAEDHYEIQCHGGNTASNAIIQSICESDDSFQVVSSNEFARHEFAPWQASTRRALTQATTERATKQILGQLATLPPAIDRVIELLEDGETESAKDLIQSMLKWSSFGIHLTLPRSVVLCGEPNVGKSSLINAIVGFQRAIVHDQPGTTRDVVSQLTAIDGWPIELKDTAGIREASGQIESEGILKAEQQIETADLVIAVFDRSIPWNSSNTEFVARVKPQVVVHNKSDLKPADAALVQDGIEVSATNRDGVAELITKLGSELVANVPEPNQAYPVTPTQVERLTTAVTLIDQQDVIKAVQLLREEF